MDTARTPTIELPEQFRRLGVTPAQVDDFCRRWKIRELAVFGSVLRDDFRDDSDVDLLVVFEEPSDVHFSDMLDMREGLASLFGRPVDLVERSVVENSENYIRRQHILQSSRLVYAR